MSKKSLLVRKLLKKVDALRSALLWQVMIFSRGSQWRTLWSPCRTWTPAQGLRRCVWAASTCWCSFPSPALCCSWPPGHASPCMAASYKASSCCGRGRSTATSSTSRPSEAAGRLLEAHTRRNLPYFYSEILFDIYILTCDQKLKANQSLRTMDQIFWRCQCANRAAFKDCASWMTCHFYNVDKCCFLLFCVCVVAQLPF